ncbi:hypothetical protein C0J52_22427, partial [Blattella germanica]
LNLKQASRANCRINIYSTYCIVYTIGFLSKSSLWNIGDPVVFIMEEFGFYDIGLWPGDRQV